MRIDYKRMLDRVDAIVKESGSSESSAELTNEICYWNCASLKRVVAFCEEYGCSMDWLVGRSDVYSVI